LTKGNEVNSVASGTSAARNTKFYVSHKKTNACKVIKTNWFGQYQGTELELLHFPRDTFSTSLNIVIS